MKIMKSFVLMAVLLGLAGTLAAEERVRGTLDSVYLEGKLVVVNGKEYKVNTEYTKVIYRGLSVGEESLRKGDQVELVFADSKTEDGLSQLLQIRLLRGSKSGLDS